MNQRTRSAVGVGLAGGAVVGGVALGCLFLSSGCGADGVKSELAISAGTEAEDSATAEARAPRAAARMEALGYVAGAGVEGSESPEPFSALKVVNDEAFDAMFFEHYGVNPTIDTQEEPRSTFSIDVDTASWSVAKAYLERNELPPPEAVRVEEFVNAHDYYYEPPTDGPFAVFAEAVPSPTRPGYDLLHVGIRGRDVAPDERRPARLTFVIDVSGSMDRENRLGLVKRSLRILVDTLREGDSVGIVTYGSDGKVRLKPTPVEQRQRILAVVDALQPEGATNAVEGIELGYELASDHLLEGGINRVILCSDGVANLGPTTSAEGIHARIQDEIDRGITLSAVGFGMGNYNDVLMEKLAQHGAGNYHYLDAETDAQRLFGDELSQMLEVIAWDMKVQVEFDPATVSRYRLLGYENRRLEAEEFEDDFVDAGEIGPGHTVTALYEVKRTGQAGDLGTVRVRYKQDRTGESVLLERALPPEIVRASFDEGSDPVQASAVVALFAEKMRESYWVRRMSYDGILEIFDMVRPELRRHDELRTLESLILTARRIDERDDKFSLEVALDAMTFDRVPRLER